MKSNKYFAFNRTFILIIILVLISASSYALSKSRLISIYVVGSVKANNQQLYSLSEIDVPCKISTNSLSICDLQFLNSVAILIRQNTEIEISYDINNPNPLLEIKVTKGTVLLKINDNSPNGININAGNIMLNNYSGELLVRKSNLENTEVLVNKGSVGYLCKKQVCLINEGEKITFTGSNGNPEKRILENKDYVYLLDLKEVIFFTDDNINYFKTYNVKPFEINNKLDNITSLMNYIIIIDTSKSMNFLTAPKDVQLFDLLRRELYYLLNTIEVGSKICLISFDSDVNEHFTLSIYSKKDRYTLYESIITLEAKGFDTSLSLMIDKIIEKAQEFESIDPDKQVTVYILSDGKDDPPNEANTSKKQLLNAIEVIQKKNWKINLIDLTYYSKKKKKNNAELFEIAKLYKKIFNIIPLKDLDLTYSLASQFELDKKIAKIKYEKKFVEQKKSPAPKREPEEESLSVFEYIKKYFNPIFLIIPFSILLIYQLYRFFVIYRSKREVILTGILEYYCKDVPFKKRFEVDLRNYHTKQISIGADVTCDIVISDSKWYTPFFIKAMLKKNRPYYMVDENQNDLTFSIRHHRNLLSYGDTFEIGNYIFCYKGYNKPYV